MDTSSLIGLHETQRVRSLSTSLIWIAAGLVGIGQGLARPGKAVKIYDEPYLANSNNNINEGATFGGFN